MQKPITRHAINTLWKKNILFITIVHLTIFSNAQNKNMNTTNLKYLPEIVEFMENPDQHWEKIVETNTAQFKSDILLEDLYYPSSFESDDAKEDKANLKKLKAKNIFEPYEKTFLEPSDIGFLSDEAKKNKEEYSLVLMSFEIPPIPELKWMLRMQLLQFYLIPSYYEDGTLKVTVFYNATPYLNHFENISGAKILTEDTQDEKEKSYLKIFSQVIEIICNDMKISTEQNQGKFVENVKEDPEKLIEEFIEITHAKDFNDAKRVKEFIKYWKMIKNNPQKYLDLLIDEGYADEETEIDEKDFYQHLLSDFLCAYDTDWKMDHEDLSEFISEEIKQDFKITYEETLQKPSVINEKIEKESDYTLLNIDTQMDSYSFFICKKQEKEKILDLAKKLGFPIEDY